MNEEQEKQNVEEPSKTPRPPKFLVKAHVIVRGDIVQWFRELYKKCQKDQGFQKVYLENPTKALLIELSRDVWRSPPSEEFERRFEAALQEKGDVRLESMEGPFDPYIMLELAEKIYKDDEFAKDFRADPVRFLHRDVALRAEKKSSCKATAKHTWKCEGEVGVECGFEW